MTNIDPGVRRIMDRAYLRDRQTEYTGEALLLAMLLHTKNARSRDNEKYVARLLDDPNQKV